MKTLTLIICSFISILIYGQSYDNRFDKPSIIYEIDNSIKKWGFVETKSFLDERTYSFIKNDTIYVLAYDINEYYKPRPITCREKNRTTYLYRRDIYGNWDMVSKPIKIDYQYYFVNSNNYDIMFGFTYKYGDESYGYVNFIDDNYVVMLITNFYTENQYPNTTFIYNYILIYNIKNKNVFTYYPTNKKTNFPELFGKYAIECNYNSNSINIKFWDSAIKFRKLTFNIFEHNVNYVGDINLIQK